MLISNGYVNVNITKADENRLRISITGNLLVEARRIWFVLVEEKGGREEKIFPFIIIRIIISDIYIRSNVMAWRVCSILPTNTEKSYGIIAYIYDIYIYTNNVEFFFFFFCLKYIVLDPYETSSDSIPNDGGHFYSGASPFPNDRLVNFWREPRKSCLVVP